jgi:hypothetical protein
VTNETERRDQLIHRAFGQLDFAAAIKCRRLFASLARIAHRRVRRDQSIEFIAVNRLGPLLRGHCFVAEQPVL